MNPHQPMHINLKTLKTRFALRFLRALRNINEQANNNIDHDQTNVAQRYHKVKVAADASIASVVGPRMAWSRAMLLRTRPMSRRARREVLRRRNQLKRREKRRQAEELRRLVPGGEAMDLQSLLDETSHYVMCLATQVKVMRSILNYCSTQ